MEFSAMMEIRRSCRNYQDKTVPREYLVKIAEAGRLTPSACNAQPWKFIVIDEPEAKRRLCDALVLENGITTCLWREQVPAFFVLCERQVAMPDLVQKLYGDSQYYAPGDIGAAAMNMCHQAMELGLGTCILGLNNQEKMSRYFGIPADCKARLVLAVGYSAEKNEAPIKMRMGIDEVCSFNHW